jgi:hypothetical protein
VAPILCGDVVIEEAAADIDKTPRIHTDHFNAQVGLGAAQPAEESALSPSPEKIVECQRELGKLAIKRIVRYTLNRLPIGVLGEPPPIDFREPSESRRSRAARRFASNLWSSRRFCVAVTPVKELQNRHAFGLAAVVEQHRAGVDHRPTIALKRHCEPRTPSLDSEGGPRREDDGDRGFSWKFGHSG